MENIKKNMYKKRIIAIVSFVCLLLVTYGIINMRKLPNQIAKVNATPLANKVIVIDAGHGLPDERSSWI